MAVGREAGLGERRPTVFKDPAGAEPSSREVAGDMVALTMPGNARLFAENGEDELAWLLNDSLGAREPCGVEDACLTRIGALSPHVSDSVAIVSPPGVIEGLRGGGAVGGGDNICDLGVGLLAGSGTSESEMALGRNWGGAESLEGLGVGYSSSVAFATAVTGADDAFLGFRARSFVG
jgi:hypothetical protein